MLRKILVTVSVFLIAYVFAGPAQALQTGNHGYNNDWKYDAPSCTALSVKYPDRMPQGQANDVNVKLKNLENGKTATLNFHKNDGTWRGTQTFKYSDSKDWPAWDHYAVTWVQVAGTNYHWEGKVECGEAPVVDVCTNLDGVQKTVPDDYTADGSKCTHKPVDVCVDGSKKTISWSDYKGKEGSYKLYDSDTCKKKERNHNPKPTAKSYVIVAWSMPNWNGNNAVWPQKYKTSAKQTTPNLNALDSQLNAVGYGCYQIDIYYDDATTTSLINGGKLNGPNNPNEHLINGGLGTAWKFLKVGNSCNPPVDVCTNIDGNQTSIPDGYYAEGTKCKHKPVDVCVDYAKKTIPWSDYNGHENSYTLYDSKTCKPPTQTKSYVIVAWSMPGWNGNSPVWPQKYKTHQKQTTPNLNALDSTLNAVGYGCYQIDIYYDDATTTSLINGKNLYGPNNPTEHLIKGGYGTAYKFLKVGNSCEPPKDICKNLDGTQTTVPAGFIKDGDNCYKKVPVCEYTKGDLKGHKVWYASNKVPSSSKPWVDGSECTPPNIDLSSLQPICSAGAPYITIDVKLYDPGHNSTTSNTVDLLFFDGRGHSYPLNNVPLNNWKATVLWPGATVSGGVPTGWPGWAANSDGSWTDLGDGNFGWTRSGASVTVTYNPSKTFTLTYPQASFECEPPAGEYCVYTPGDPTGELVVVQPGDTIPTGAKPWTGNGADCAPDVCPNIVGKQVTLPPDLQFFTIDGKVKCGKPPTLAGTIVSSVCKSDVPWIFYRIQLNDPYGVSTNNTGKAKFTFTAAGSSEKYEKEVSIGNGQFLWPGASAKYLGNGKYEATGWPGWALKNGEWVSVGTDNYGWTRNGVSVLVEVNPTMSVNLAYPPPTKLCVAGPPTEVHNQLDAPPADAVEAEAQYAG